MRNLIALYSTVILCFIIGSCNSNNKYGFVRLDINVKPFEKISEYSFFKETNDFAKPNKGVVPYKMVNSMFNDYSFRDCFMYIPDRKTFSFDSANLLNAPVGSCLINIVYYWKDVRNPSLGKQLIETQLLIRKPTGWEANTYHWTDDQKDAVLTDNGGSKTINFTDKNGLAHQLKFIMPTKEECKSCHISTNWVRPIGVNAGNLNISITDTTGRKNQLGRWIEAGLLKNYVGQNLPAYVNYNDTTQPLALRARAYLDANCAHCHSANGPANVSGLFLNADNNNMSTYGVCKPPQAKGHGTCNLDYDIVPGKPAESVIVGRLASAEFGVKMPELGRTLVDTAGLALITQWITQLKGECK